MPGNVVNIHVYVAYYTYINYDIFHTLLSRRMYTCKGPDVRQQGARQFLIKIFIRHIIILSIWAQAYIENTKKTKKPAHRNHTPCVSKPISFIIDVHCFLLVGYILSILPFLH